MSILLPSHRYLNNKRENFKLLLTYKLTISFIISDAAFGYFVCSQHLDYNIPCSLAFYLINLVPQICDFFL